VITLAVGILTEIAFPLAICLSLFFGGLLVGVFEQFYFLLRNK
jgi:hypothetical protein